MPTVNISISDPDGDLSTKSDREISVTVFDDNGEMLKRQVPAVEFFAFLSSITHK